MTDNENKNGESAPEMQGPMTEERFAAGLSQLVCDALTGQVTFGAVVSLLEVTKVDVIELWRGQVRAAKEMQRPRLIMPDKNLER